MALAEAGNARGEQGTAALSLLHAPWRSGKVYELETRAAGVSARIECGVHANYTWGSCAEQHRSTEPVHTDVSTPHSTEPRNGELTVCDNLGQCSAWKASVN